MVINSYSAFYYGHLITTNNYIVPINEGAGELDAEVSIGSYTLSDFVEFVAQALNEYGSLDYEVTVDRTTRLVTISASGNFSLLFASSLQSELSIYNLLGFELQDYTGSDTYTGSLPSGSVYYPQFKLQDFFDFDTIRRSNEPTVRTTASGKVEVVKYANSNFMRCTISYITNIIGQSVIQNNPNGVQSAIDFMGYITNKYSVEFIYDVNDVNNFVPCILESTSTDQNGTGFELEPLYSRGLTGYYELSNLLFRRLI